MNQNSIPRMVNAIGILLLVLFGSLVLFDTLPVRLLQPDWIFNLSIVLGNYVSIPLVGITLVHLGGYLDPDDLGRVQLRVARLSAILALLFLLIQPMMAFAVWRNFQTLTSFNKEQVALINKKSVEITQAIQTSDSFDELRMRMLRLQGPQIPEQARYVSLPTLKKQLVDLIKAARDSAPGRLTTPTSSAYVDFYKRLARTTFINLLSMIGFTLLAWNPRRNQNVVFSYLASLGLFGITPKSIFERFVSFLNEREIRQQEKGNASEIRRSAMLHQRQIRKAESLMRRRELAEQRQAERARREREKILELERRMERKRDLQEEKERQRRGD
ncbi:MAG: hypothetical protein ACK6BG_04440 [Cyanobacteriota bacterium]